ncbi:MAG: molybdate ABC transporter permease subunit [Alphaproteobacteria bacterium]|nr:molybdate ABC transporter permease subunit [Alphaproteobacteria bacterium]
MSAEEITVVMLSFKVALLATLFCLPVAVALAFALARLEFRGKTLVNALAHLPLLLPPVVTGYLLLAAFGRKGYVGGPLLDVLGVTIAFKWTGAAVAAAVMALPIMMQPIRVAFEVANVELEEAARTLGATRLQCFFTITLPLAAPGLIAAAVLGFVKSLGEFGATITFVSNIPGETQTLALAIYSLIQTPNGDAAANRLIWLSIALAFAALLLADAFSRRLRRGRISPTIPRK